MNPLSSLLYNADQLQADCWESTPALLRLSCCILSQAHAAGWLPAVINAACCCQSPCTAAPLAASSTEVLTSVPAAAWLGCVKHSHEAIC